MDEISNKRSSEKETQDSSLESPKKKTKEIDDYPKNDNRFKFIFGPNNQHIMKRLLTDYLPFTINDDQKMIYLQPTLTDNQYLDVELRPNLNISVEIDTKERQDSHHYYNKENKNSKEKSKEKEEREGKEKEHLKRIIVEMNVYDYKNTIRRIEYNSMKSYSTYFRSGSKYDDMVDVYTLNFVYGPYLRINEEENNTSNNEKSKSKYMYYLYADDPENRRYCFPNLHIFVVEMFKFDINNFNENNEKDLWTAFFKSLTYEIIYNKMKKYEGEPNIVKLNVNHLTEELYGKLRKINEIDEALEFCEALKNINIKY